MKKLFQAKGSFDLKVRRTVSLLLAFVMCTSFLFIFQINTSSDAKTKSTYNEPNVRVIIYSMEDELSHLDFNSTGGYRYGYVNKDTDEYTEIGRTNLTSGKVILDDGIYIEFSSLLMGGVLYEDLSKEPAKGIVDGVIAGYFPLIPSCHNQKFCYRAGPFTSAEEANAYIDMIVSDIQMIGGDYTLNANVFVSDSKTVLLMNMDGFPLYSFTSDSDGYAAAVTPILVDQWNSYLTAGGYNYPGILEFRRYENPDYQEKALTVINVIPLETYVACVNSAEIYTSWSLETHKIFSVLVRTYTMRQVLQPKHRDEFADICCDVHCQAYRGQSRVNDTLKQAVKETEGLVLHYGDDLAATFYSAVAGGTTVSYEDAWSSMGYDYLVAKPTPWERYKDYAPYTSAGSWHVELTGGELYNKLKRYSRHKALKGDIASVQIEQLCKDSTYIYKIVYTDIYGNTSFTTKSDTIRRELGFYSGNFVVGRNGETVSFDEWSLEGFPSFYSSDYDGFKDYLSYTDASASILFGDLTTQKIPTSGSVLTSKGVSNYDLRTDIFKVIFSNDTKIVTPNGLPDILNAKPIKETKTMVLKGAEGKFIFEGRGYGHGIGFSQYGIWDMSTLGYDMETIIRYHMKDVGISKLDTLNLKYT